MYLIFSKPESWQFFISLFNVYSVKYQNIQTDFNFYKASYY